MLEDDLEIITRLLGPGRATYEGRHASVRGAINVPKGLQQPRIPIIVGGNGRNVTMRLAARFADELNLVYIDSDEVAELIPIAHQRCDEIGRDPSTLRLSIYTRDEHIQPVGEERVDFLGRLDELGLDRVVCFPARWDVSLEALERFADDARKAGLEMAAPVAA